MHKTLLLIIYLFFQTAFGQTGLENNLHSQANKKILGRWLNYYKIDLSDFELKNSDEHCINCKPIKDSNNYFREFKSKDDSDKLIAVNYSLSNRKYVSLGVMLENKDNKNYFNGWDDCQEIYLTDRDLKHHNLVLWLGSASLAEDVFWNKNENIFYIVGFETYSGNHFFIYEFNIDKNTIIKYETKSTERKTAYNYFKEVFLKERNILDEY